MHANPPHPPTPPSPTLTPPLPLRTIHPSCPPPPPPPPPNLTPLQTHPDRYGSAIYFVMRLNRDVSNTSFSFHLDIRSENSSCLRESSIFLFAPLKTLGFLASLLSASPPPHLFFFVLGFCCFCVCGSTDTVTD